MSVAFFVLRKHWYDEMLAGRKDVEYRAVTPFWTARLNRKPLTHAVFCRGYSGRRRFTRPITKIDIGPCPYRGWTGDFYRVHLGPIDNAQRPTANAQQPTGDALRPGAQVQEVGSRAISLKEVDNHE